MSGSKKISKQTRGQGAVDGFPRLLGERLCLDFINTLEKLLAAGPADFLPIWADLAWWGRHVRLLTMEDVERALKLGDDQPETAAALHARAMHLRASLTHLFTPIARHQPPGEAALRALEAEMFRAAASIGLQRTGERYAWTWQRPDQPVERLLWEITRSAVELLTVDDVHRIKECPGANDCGSLFYDASRNGARRWCSMEGCGSRVKMRRHYARHARRTMA